MTANASSGDHHAPSSAPRRLSCPAASHPDWLPIIIGIVPRSSLRVVARCGHRGIDWVDCSSSVLAAVGVYTRRRCRAAAPGASPLAQPPAREASGVRAVRAGRVLPARPRPSFRAERSGRGQVVRPAARAA